MLKLYHGTTSVCSQKVRVALAEIGLDYESNLIDLQKGEQFAPDYRRLNPNAVVPTLTDGPLVVLESSLIIEYLDKRYNQSQLMPQDPALEHRTRHWQLRCLSIHAAINTLSFSTVMRDRVLATQSPEQIEAGLARILDPVNRAKRRDLYANGLGSVHVDQALRHLRQTFAEMSTHIDGGQWVSGPAFGLADIGLVSYIDRIERLGFAGLWEATFPLVGDWLSAMRARASYAPAITSFIPESAAKSQRAGGATHWPELQMIWKASVVL